MNPLECLPPTSLAAGAWCGHAATPSPSLPALTPFLSLPRTPSQTAVPELLHARAQRTDTLRHAPLWRADTLAHTHAHTRTHTPPPAALHNATLWCTVSRACQLSIIHAVLEDRAAGATSVISSPSPNLTKHKMMPLRDSAPFAATSYFPGVAY